MFTLAQSKTDSRPQTAHALSRFAWQDIDSQDRKSRLEHDLFRSLSAEWGTSYFSRTDSLDSEQENLSAPVLFSNHDPLLFSPFTQNQNSAYLSRNHSSESGYSSLSDLNAALEEPVGQDTTIYSDFKQLTAAPLYSDVLQNVAEKNKVVIGLRDPNKMGQPLLQEGYACKGFHIKAKSSTEGPTAGFVVTDPLLGKNGVQDKEWQQTMIDKALKQEKCRTFPLYLSTERVETLLQEDKMRVLNTSASEWLVEAPYKDHSYQFILKNNSEYPETPWQVFMLQKGDAQETRIPIEGLVNPPIANESSPIGPKSIVTADYDLFCVFPNKNKANNITPIPVTDRLVTRAESGITKIFNQLLECQKDSTHSKQKEDPELGNVHLFYKGIMRQINQQVKETPNGYTGGRLVHHGAENSNPFSKQPDFPLIFYVPHQPQPFIVSNEKELLSFQTAVANQGYAAQLNRHFLIRNYQLPTNDKN